MLFALLPLAMAGPTPVLFRETVDVKGDSITLGAVADLSVLPGEVRSRAMNLTLLKIRPKARGVAISHAWLTSRARALMPALAAWLPPPKGGSLMINVDSARPGQAVTDCGEGVSKGTAVTASVSVNWFRVERKVTAVQDGKAGQRFFARTSEREIVPVFCKGSE